MFVNNVSVAMLVMLYIVGCCLIMGNLVNSVLVGCLC